MKTYVVTIKCTTYKTYRVKAETEDDAYEQAHTSFSSGKQVSVYERYEQETVDINEV